MSPDPDKRQRHLDLMRKSRRALEETELAEREQAAPRGRRKDDPSDPPASGGSDEGEVVMYRGRPVRRPSAGGAGRRSTGASFRNTSSKGAGRGRRPGGGGGGDVRDALERLNELYADGLISRADFDKKRQQILDRL
ncbi:MAG: SHOCT domain-containing protein [Acidimicrobiales bacterium]